jgi:drug/metabolite transporter (DMT)-like permease
MSNRTRAYLALLTMAVIWGAALPIVKPSLEFVSPYQFLYLRYLIATPLTLPVLFYYLIKLKPSAKILLRITALELLGTVLLLPILYFGLEQTSALEASLIGATGPIFIVLGGIIFLHEKQETHEWLGLGLSFFGTLILVFAPLITGKNESFTLSFAGNSLIFLYNLIYVLYVLLAKKFYRTIPKLFVSSLSYPIALICFFLAIFFSGGSTSPFLLTIPQVALASGYMAIPGSIIALTLFLYGQNLIEASEASLFTYLQGVVAIPVAVLWLKERLTWPMLLAIIIISLGVFLAEARPKKSKVL